jgi:hypothetical protein
VLSKSDATQTVTFTPVNWQIGFGLGMIF